MNSQKYPRSPRSASPKRKGTAKTGTIFSGATATGSLFPKKKDLLKLSKNELVNDVFAEGLLGIDQIRGMKKAELIDWLTGDYLINKTTNGFWVV